MILERALLLITAAAALAAAAAVGIVALAFAIYALLTPHLGPAGAAGAAALLFALSVGLAGLIAALRARGPKRGRVYDNEDLGLTQRLMDLVRDKPFASAGIAATVGLIAMRNPKIIAAVLMAFIEGWRKPSKP